jgi:hypothetical protein
MNKQILVPVVLTLIGVWLAGFGLATRRRPWLVAGFDPSRCSDATGLSRWVGNGQIVLGCLCVLGAALTFMTPDRRHAIGTALSLTIVAGVVVIITGVRRFQLSRP